MGSILILASPTYSKVESFCLWISRKCSVQFWGDSYIFLRSIQSLSTIENKFVKFVNILNNYFLPTQEIVPCMGETNAGDFSDRVGEIYIQKNFPPGTCFQVPYEKFPPNLRVDPFPYWYCNFFYQPVHLPPKTSYRFTVTSHEFSAYKVQYWLSP